MSFFQDEFLSPIGNLVISATDKGIEEIRFGGLWLITANPNFATEKAKELLAEYFDGKSVDLSSLPIDWYGTPFQMKTWEALRDIPFGKVCSYEQIAIRVRGDKNARAIGQAIGCNPIPIPIPILVPCHRVIGKNGKLTGFSGGIEKKKWLLDFEKRLSKNK